MISYLIKYAYNDLISHFDLSRLSEPIFNIGTTKIDTNEFISALFDTFRVLLRVIDS